MVDFLKERHYGRKGIWEQKRNIMIGFFSIFLLSRSNQFPGNQQLINLRPGKAAA